MNITTLEQWRRVPQLVEWANKVFTSREWQILNQVMQEGEHVRLFDSPGVEGIQKLGRIEGWDLYNSRLKSASVTIAPPKEIEATFEKPEIEEQEPEQSPAPRPQRKK